MRNIAGDCRPVDLARFTAGPFAGNTLFGIVEFDGENAFQWDAQPGDPDSAATARPSGFVGGETRGGRGGGGGRGQAGAC